jgi:hypothetical protein
MPIRRLDPIELSKPDVTRDLCVFPSEERLNNEWPGRIRAQDLAQNLAIDPNGTISGYCTISI